MPDEYKFHKISTSMEDEEILMEESANLAKETLEKAEFELFLEEDFYAHADSKRTIGYKQAIKTNIKRNHDIEENINLEREAHYQEKEMIKEHFRDILLRKRKESKDKSIFLET